MDELQLDMAEYTDLDHWRWRLTDAGGGAVAGKSSLIQPLGLTAQEKRDLLAFLQALTGELPTVTPPEFPY
jgi:hypothetical protein